MIEFSVIFLCVSERYFICMILHDICMIICHERGKESVCVCARARMRVFAQVHLRDVSMYRGEMLQLPCPRAHETHVIKFNLSSKTGMTSRTWTIKNKTKSKTKNVEIGVATFR